MPTVAWVAGFAIVFYWADFHDPHVHIIGKGAEAKIFIDSLKVEVKRGAISPNDLKKLCKWVGDNREKLHQAWQAARSHEPIDKIR